MGYHERVILYNKLIESLRHSEDSINSLKADLDEALRNTDHNFPNKIEKLEDQIKEIQLVEDQMTEILIVLYDFRP